MRRSSQIRYVNFDSGARQPGGLIGRIIGLVIGCVAIVAAVFVGAIFLAGLVGMVVIGWLAFMLRVWWIRRQLDSTARASGDLEGQYTVVQEENRTVICEDDRRP